MSRYVRALAWFVFIAGAFALPATMVGVHEGRSRPVSPKWPSQQIKKNGLPAQSAVAKNQNANIKSRALAVSDAVGSDTAKRARPEKQ
jgi:hypothetical protein